MYEGNQTLFFVWGERQHTPEGDSRCGVFSAKCDTIGGIQDGVLEDDVPAVLGIDASHAGDHGVL